MQELTSDQVPQCFTYQFYETNRYTISESNGYQAMCNNGFTRLYTVPTRVYYLAQNQFQHRVPDWKLHISVAHEDLKRAWSTVVKIFMSMKCRSGLKVIYLKESSNSMRGRQITIYIMKYAQQFKQSSFAQQFGVSIANEHSQQFWRQMINQIQEQLTGLRIKSNGTADGDLAIGHYVSLRNQAFVLDDQGQHYIYPPNEKGWNPLKHEIPIKLQKIELQPIKNILAAQNKYNFSIRTLFNLPTLLSIPIIIALVYWKLHDK